MDQAIETVFTDCLSCLSFIVASQRNCYGREYYVRRIQLFGKVFRVGRWTNPSAVSRALAVSGLLGCLVAMAFYQLF